jgi:hypothetical protein
MPNSQHKLDSARVNGSLGRHAAMAQKCEITKQTQSHF